MATKFFEHVESNARRIDREAGVIRDVKVCGASSRNNREYSQQALRDIAQQAEGADVYLDHDKKNPGNRAESRAWGTLRGVRLAGDEVRGDLHYIKSHSETPRLLERIERGIGRLGLSIAAEGKTSQRGSRTIIEAIDKVFSVDIVAGPATTESLFEDRSSYLDARSLLKSPGGYVHATPRPRPNRRGAQPNSGFDAYVSSIFEEMEGSSGDEVAAAFESAALAIIRKRGPLDETLAKLKKLLKARDEALGTDATGGAPQYRDFDNGLAGAGVDDDAKPLHEAVLHRSRRGRQPLYESSSGAYERKDAKSFARLMKR